MLNDFVTGTATENDLSFQGDGSLSIPFYNRFRQYAHYKVALVTMKLLNNGYDAYNFYGESIPGCLIYKVDIQVEVSYPCDDSFKFLKPSENYQILIKIIDADLNIVLVGTKRTRASRRIPASINADTYEHHVTAENFTIEQYGDDFNVTFPIAPRHLDMPNRFDIQIPSKGITLLNITRGEVASLDYYWWNYRYTVDQIKLSAGKRISISLIVWNKDGSNLIMEKNYTFPQKTTTPTGSSSTPETDPELIITDTYEHHVTTENITIEQSGDGFNVTFPIAPHHLDMPNRFDIQIPSKGITLPDITRGEVTSLNYHWQNYTYTVDQIKVSAGEQVTISLIVWNRDGSNLILEKNYTFPQISETRTGSSLTPKTNPKLIIAICVSLVVFIVVAAILVFILRQKPEFLERILCFPDRYPKIVVWRSAGRYLQDMEELQNTLIEHGAENVILCDGVTDAKFSCKWILHCEESQSKELKEFCSNHGKKARMYRVNFRLNANEPTDLTADYYVLPQDLRRLLVDLGVSSCDEGEQQKAETSAIPDTLPQPPIQAANLTRTSQPNSPQLNQGGYPYGSCPLVVPVAPHAESSTSETQLHSTSPHASLSHADEISLVGPHPHLTTPRWERELDIARYVAECTNESQAISPHIDAESVCSFHTDAPDGKPSITENLQPNSTQRSQQDPRTSPSGVSNPQITTPIVVVNPYRRGNNTGARLSTSASLEDLMENQTYLENEETGTQFAPYSQRFAC